MTREEEIIMAGTNWYARVDSNYYPAVSAFNRGAEWADRNQPSPWISVEDRLPEKDGYYLTLFKRNNYMCVLQFEHRLWKTIGYQSDITHWMQIPELPERRR